MLFVFDCQRTVIEFGRSVSNFRFRAEFTARSCRSKSLDQHSRQALVGRRAGHPLNVNDITSRHCQQRKRVRVERLDRFDVKKGQWREAVVEDHRTPVPDQAAFRCDFPEWLKTLSDRDRQIAETLSTGEGTTSTAKQFGVTAGRVSQLRGELHEAWREFHGETVCAAAAG